MSIAQYSFLAQPAGPRWGTSAESLTGGLGDLHTWPYLHYLIFPKIKRARCCMANTPILVEGGSYVFAFVLARLLIRTRKFPSYRMSMVYVERI